VYFEQGAIRLSAEQRQLLIDLVRKPMAEPRCRYQSWHIVGHVGSNPDSSIHAAAKERAEYVAGLVRQYGVEGKNICGAWSGPFPGEEFPKERSLVVEAGVTCQLVPGC
jgi:hypothetical protein